MSIAYEANTDIGFDTQFLYDAANDYGTCANDLRTNASQLSALIEKLVEDGWTTDAGKTFLSLTKDEWAVELEKYAVLLDSLKDILMLAVEQYDNLVMYDIHNTKISF